jgi:hypothetical protein
MILQISLIEFKDESMIIDKIYNLTFERVFSLNEGFAGTNRSDLLEKDFAFFIDNPFLGVGTNNANLGGANFWAIFARYGVIGSLFYYIHILYMGYVAIRSRRLVNFNLIIVIFSMLFYRPELSSVLTLLCIITLVISMNAADLKNRVWLAK